MAPPSFAISAKPECKFEAEISISSRIWNISRMPPGRITVTLRGYSSLRHLRISFCVAARNTHVARSFLRPGGRQVPTPRQSWEDNQLPCSSPQHKQHPTEIIHGEWWR